MALEAPMSEDERNHVRRRKAARDRWRDLRAYIDCLYDEGLIEEATRQTMDEMAVDLWYWGEIMAARLVQRDWIKEQEDDDGAGSGVSGVAGASGAEDQGTDGS